MTIRLVLLLLGIVFGMWGWNSSALARECSSELTIAGQKFAALNCCRCKSGGSPCRCGKAAGFTNCDPCTTECTTGFKDEDEIIKAAERTPRIPRLVAAIGEQTIIFKGQFRVDELNTKNTTSNAFLVVKVPSGNLYLQPATAGKEFALEIPSTEFGITAAAQINLGELVLGDDQRVYFISFGHVH